jgi:hypothetical protein
MQPLNLAGQELHSRKPRMASKVIAWNLFTMFEMILKSRYDRLQILLKPWANPCDVRKECENTR